MTTPWPEVGLSSIAVVASGMDRPEDLVLDDDGVLWAGGDHGQLYQIDLESPVVRQVSEDAGSLLGLAIGPTGRILACDRARRCVIEYAQDLSTRVFFRGTLDEPLRAPNGIAVDEDGTVFVSDSGTSGQADGVIFRIEASGVGRVWSRGAPRHTNGLGIALGALYVAETHANRVARLRIAPHDGRCLGEDLSIPTGDAIPDGIAIASDGALAIICPRPSSILRWSEHDGLSVLASDPGGTVLDFPTNGVFRDRTTLLVTSRHSGSIVAVDWPAA